MIELTEDNLDFYLKNNERVIVMFAAKWCGNCENFKKTFKEFSKDKSNCLFIYLDADAFPKSRDIIELENIPTIVSFYYSKILKHDKGTYDTLYQLHKTLVERKLLN